MKIKTIFRGSVSFSSIFILTIFLVSLTGCVEPENNAQEQLITVLNPAISSTMAERVPLAERAKSLEGKTLYMVDLQWGGPEAAYSVFEEMKIWFSENMPSVKTEIRRSKGGPFGDDPALRNEIVANKAAGVIVGIAG